MKGRVTVVIPHWNKRDLLLRALAALRLQTETPATIIVIDNGSTDGSAEAADDTGVRVIRLKRNEGFAHAVNLGIMAVRTEWVAVMNNDVQPEPDYLERLVDAAAAQDAWFAAGKLLKAGSNGIIDGTFDLIARSGCAWRAGEGRPDGDTWSQPRRIALTSFTASVFRTDLFAELGGLDEEFGSYLEDVDFGIRCAMASRDGVYVPDAKAWHESSATLGVWAPEMVRLIARNQLLLVAKHYPGDWRKRYGREVIAGQLLWGLMALVRGRGMSFIQGKREAWRELERLQALEKPDEQLLASFLESSEEQIRQLQGSAGFDRYWKWYFALAGKRK